ncbi:MAG: hypothetical protein JXO72_10825 [Vicinamibacteria bacterium]|nr:hypothetical protein [Vicinamibacteria bacterium]
MHSIDSPFLDESPVLATIRPEQRRISSFTLIRGIGRKGFLVRGICGYAWFLAGWAKRMSWKAVAEAFQVSWGSVFRSVEMAVDWGRRHMPLDEIEVIGVDEILWRRGYRLLTLVYQIDESAQQACVAGTWLSHRKPIAKGRGRCRRGRREAAGSDSLRSGRR